MDIDTFSKKLVSYSFFKDSFKSEDETSLPFFKSLKTIIVFSDTLLLPSILKSLTTSPKTIKVLKKKIVWVVSIIN